eukprot:355075-Chlamydomonas_euryale.AAC.2
MVGWRARAHQRLGLQASHDALCGCSYLFTPRRTQHPSCARLPARPAASLDPKPASPVPPSQTRLNPSPLPPSTPHLPAPARAHRQPPLPPFPPVVPLRAPVPSLSRRQPLTFPRTLPKPLLLPHLPTTLRAPAPARAHRQFLPLPPNAPQTSFAPSPPHHPTRARACSSAQAAPPLPPNAPQTSFAPTPSHHIACTHACLRAQTGSAGAGSIPSVPRGGAAAAFASARRALSLAAPRSLPCRDAEKARIARFLLDAVGCGGAAAAAGGATVASVPVSSPRRQQEQQRGAQSAGVMVRRAWAWKASGREAGGKWQASEREVGGEWKGSHGEARLDMEGKRKGSEREVAGKRKGSGRGVEGESW